MPPGPVVVHIETPVLKAGGDALLTADGIQLTGGGEELNELNCVLQFVRSGRVAITKSNNERVSEFLEYREEKYRKQKLGLND